jgi:hypothetical protein
VKSGQKKHPEEIESLEEVFNKYLPEKELKAVNRILYG